MKKICVISQVVELVPLFFFLPSSFSTFPIIGIVLLFFIIIRVLLVSCKTTKTVTCGEDGSYLHHVLVSNQIVTTSFGVKSASMIVDMLCIVIPVEIIASRANWILK